VSAPRQIRLWLALLAAIGPAVARADGISGLLELDYIHARGEPAEAAGAQRFDADQLTQRYRLVLDRGLFPYLRFMGGGAFEQVDLWSDAAPPLDRQVNRTTNLFANLYLNGPFVTGASGYQWRLQSSRSGTGDPLGIEFSQFSWMLGFRPTDLPWLVLRFDRPEVHDRHRVLEDQVSNIGNLVLTWRPARQLDLRYAASVLNSEDRIHQSETTLITQSAQATYAEQIPDRASISLAGNVINHQLNVSATGSGATVATQLFPIAGLSVVEVFPAIPEQVTLATNAAVIDTVTNASAGINIGFGPTLSGDANYRDIGVQFADAITRVNTFYLWVDKRLTPQVAAAFTSRPGAATTARNGLRSPSSARPSSRRCTTGSRSRSSPSAPVTSRSSPARSIASPPRTRRSRTSSSPSCRLISPRRWGRRGGRGPPRPWRAAAPACSSERASPTTSPPSSPSPRGPMPTT